MMRFFKMLLWSLVAAVVLFALGFLAGMEYKSYLIRASLQEAFAAPTQTAPTDTANTVMQQAAKENMTLITKQVGEELVLATMNLTVTKAEEKQTLNPSYGTPKVAKEGTKFVVVKLDVTNTTSSAFSFSPDMILVDSQKREFSTYSDSIGAVPDYLNYRELSPSIKESGSLIYELPSDATEYRLTVAKAGTNELYQVALR